MTATQVSKCPFHAAQRFLTSHSSQPVSAASDQAPFTAKTIPFSRTPKMLQAAHWALNPVGYMEKNVKRHGDVFRAPVTPSKSYCLLSDPKAIQYLLTHDRGQELSAPGELNHIFSPLAGLNNVIGASGKQHQRQRKLIMPSFSHKKCVGTYSKVVQQVTQEAITQWQVGDSLDVRIVMQKITLRVILQVVLGLNKGARYEALERLLSLLLNRVATPTSSLLLFVPWLRKDLGPWSPGGRLRQLKTEIDDLLFAEIEERRANTQLKEKSEEAPEQEPEGTDVLSLLLAAKDEAGNGLSNQALRDQLMMLLIAGFETTTIALTWAMYWIHREPKVR